MVDAAMFRALAEGGRAFQGTSPKGAAAHVAGLVYLATPYTRRVARVGGRVSWLESAQCSFEAAQYVDGFSDLGVTALSPIVLAHAACRARLVRLQLQHVNRRALDATFWTAWCAPLLAACRVIYVPDLPGWRESAGVAFEIQAGLDGGKIVILEGML